MMFPNVLNRIANYFGLDTKPSPEPKRKRRPNGVNVRLAVTLPALMVEVIEQTAEREGLPVSLVVEHMLLFAMEDVDNQGETDETTRPQKILPETLDLIKRLLSVAQNVYAEKEDRELGLYNLIVVTIDFLESLNTSTAPVIPQIVPDCPVPGGSVD